MISSPNITPTTEDRANAARLNDECYIYQADLWCGECIRDMVAKALNRSWEYVEGLNGAYYLDPNTGQAFDKDGYATDHTGMRVGGTDTDTFPSSTAGLISSEADTPQHCAAGETCLQAESLAHRGYPWRRSKVGHFFKNPLTEEGRRYVEQAVKDAEMPHQIAVTGLWADHYDIGDEDEEE